MPAILPFHAAQDKEPPYPLPLPEPLRGHGLVRCLDIIGPLIAAARTRVRNGAFDLATRYSSLPFDPEAIEPLLALNLAEPLLMMMTRVMVLELNVARLQTLLTGDTPEERFASFLNRLEDPEITSRLLDEYPVMVDQIVHRLETWSAFNLEFLEHLCNDWDLIRKNLITADPGLLAEVQLGAGDTHRGGRSVVIASFANGARIVYKPRSLAVDEHFQHLLSWLNGLELNRSFAPLRLWIVAIMDGLSLSKRSLVSAPSKSRDSISAKADISQSCMPSKPPTSTARICSLRASIRCSLTSRRFSTRGLKKAMPKLPVKPQGAL